MKFGLASDWYKTAYTLHMTEEAWTQSTVKDVDFIWNALGLSPGMTLLDVACGFGRHAIEFAKRGIQVTGIDISDELIEYAENESTRQGVKVNWRCSDARLMDYHQCFDVVTNLYDGAIGYALDDIENNNFFTTLVQALKPGGMHLMHIPNYEYISKHFPQKCWRSTDSHIELIELELDSVHNYMFETTYYLSYGKVLEYLAPIREGKRIYSVKEIEKIWSTLGMKMHKVYGGFELRSPNDCVDDNVVVVSLRNK